ncbi:hypothetical protein JYU34_002159 [Plutella xylostella]|uniref:Reverse transcriptase domain-containing protein n=1 Tax=Plutella xylostella TaxID=51655 RepID=A0ABQ7R1I3_PLUXY|nr:hypothetical protein JYU34_002159 [Plutella xylostella]
MFKSRRGKMWTWISPDGKTKNQIDFIMTNQPNSFYNVKVLSHFMIDSDHRPVIAKLSIEKPRRQWTPQNFTKQYVHTDVHSILIRKLLDNKHDTTQEMYNKLEKVLIDIEKDSTTQVKEKINVISSETKSIIAERNKIKWKSNKTNTEKQQLRSLQKEARHRIRKDLRLHYVKMVEEIMGTTGSIKEIEKRKKIGKDMISTLQQSSGKFTSSRHEILETATAFYKALYDSDDILETCITNKALKDIPPLLKSEIRYVIENLKNNKATGKDKISNEVIKCYCEDLLEPLQLIYNKILHTGTLPKQWYLASIILLHKKKCQKDINNYRPISLSSTLYKIFMTVLKNRLYRALDENQTVEQAGFRKGFSTMDHLHTLNMIIEKYSEYNKSLYICFIDFTKAFDSINQNYLLRALQNQGIDAGYVKILEKVYSKSMASINLETEGPTFPLRKGVKQGDPISPLLFNSLLEEVFRSIDWRDRGIKINGINMTSLRFADDIIFVSESSNELQETLSTFQTALASSGLQINETKTKLMTNTTQTPININNIDLEYVEDYIYLGQNISFKEKMDKEITRRINIGWKKYWSLKHIFKSKLHQSLKSKVFNTCILPAMTYGAQTWAATVKQKQKLAVNQRAMERSMLGIKRADRITNEKIRKTTKIDDIITTTRLMKWQWAGHIMRCEDNRWTRLTTEWIPRDGKRSVGRPRIRWSDELKAFHPVWWREASNRNVWRKMGSEFATQQTVEREN